jgi:membrane protein YqaA with SNARE-associated domain
MLKQLYAWSIKHASHPRATWILALISFTESSVSPIPPDPLMFPMVIANRDRAWFLASICTAASVVGGALGYAIGYYLFQSIGVKILDFYNLNTAFETLQAWFNKWGFWIIVVKGLTPIPFKVVTITSGVTKLNFVTFILASIISRGSRFFIEAALLWRYGPKMHAIIEKNIWLVTISFITLLVLGFWVLKYIVC